MKEAGELRPTRFYEAETQTDLQLLNLPMETSEAEPSPLTPGRSLTLDLTHRTSGYFSREQSFVKPTPRASRESTPLNSRRSRETTPHSTRLSRDGTPLHSTPRLPSLASYNGNPVCDCQGWVGISRTIEVILHINLVKYPEQSKVLSWNLEKN